MFNKNEYQRQWRKNNPEKVKQYNDNAKKYKHQWRVNNRERLIEHDKQRYKGRREKKIKWQIQYEAIKRKTSPKFNLNQRIKRAIQHSLKGNKNSKCWEILGYAKADLIKCLKFTLPEDYAWNDYLEGKLQIDHKIPISVFNFNSPEHIDFKRCWALSNLRLLPARENLEKHDKLLKPFQPALKI